MDRSEGFAYRLKSILKGKNRKDIAAKSGVGYTTLDKYLRGDTLPGLKALVGLARETGVSINWLATGEGPRDSQPQIAHVLERTESEQGGAMLEIVDAQEMQDKALILLPRLDVEAAAGSGSFVEREDVFSYVAFDVAWLRARQITPQAARILTARGDSMEPTIRNGDFLIIDTAISVAVDSGVYVVVYNGLLLVKRLFLLRNNAILISSDNKIAARDEEVAANEVDQLHIAGRVMWYGRGI